MKRILILMHTFQNGRSGLLIHAFRDAWRNRGLKVSCIYGIEEHPDADLLIPQIDLTHTPAEYVEYIRSYPNVANRKVVDVSKRGISKQLLSGDEDYDGPVIVKTDNNFGGLPECRRFLLSRLRERVVPLAEFALGKHLAWRRVLRKYRIYNRLTEVPAGVFENRALVVERFLPEREGARYFMRHYIFLGDHARSIRLASPTPIMKSSDSVLAGEGLPVPGEVVELRKQTGLDYGKIDYTMHDGRVVILDINKTPGAPAATAKTVGDLADGIWSLLQKKAGESGAGR